MPISQEQFIESADTLGVSVAAVKAVASVEGGGIGMLNGKPIIRFEPHVFYKQLRSLGIKPVISDICYPVWNSKERSRTQKEQWDRLSRASKINATAAVKSASWGMFQCMGFNYKTTGCKTIAEFVKAMSKGEDEQLRLFMNYIKNSMLDDELRNRDWKGFAKQYNGALYYKNSYDKKLAKAYLSFS